jgi:hypothetical protein
LLKTPSQTGFQPRNTPVERRAFFDTQRELASLRDEMNAAIADLHREFYYTRRAAAFWQYSNTTTPPPGAGQMRSNVPLTHLYIHNIDSDGYNRKTQMDFIVTLTAVDPTSVRVRIRGTSGAVYELRSNGAAAFISTYYSIPVTAISGSSTDKGFRVEVTILTGIWAEDEPPV